jgi:hypothetical protein
MSSHRWVEQTDGQPADRHPVLRNYLERRNDPVDRRRMEVRLTESGTLPWHCSRLRPEEKGLSEATAWLAYGLLLVASKRAGVTKGEIW